MRKGRGSQMYNYEITIKILYFLSGKKIYQGTERRVKDATIWLNKGIQIYPPTECSQKISK